MSDTELSKPRRRQLLIKTGLVSALSVGAIAAWLGWEYEQDSRRARAEEVFRKAGGKVDRFRVSLGEDAKDSALEYLDWIDRIEVLNLSRTAVTDAGLAHLRRHRELREIVLWRTPKITDAGLVHLAGLPELRALYLDGTKITDAGLAHLAGLPQLVSLYLSDTNIGDAGLAHLKGLERLGGLDLTNTHVGDAGLAHLAGLGQLQGLILVNTLVTNAGMVHLKSLLRLESLDVNQTRVTREGAEILRNAIPGISVGYRL
jgi:internalin A